MRLFDLKGKAAIVTGCSPDTGRSIAENCAARGEKVVISRRKAQAREEVAAAIRKAGAKAIAIPASISDKVQLDHLVAETRRSVSPIDILVCNAASHLYFGPSTGLTDEVFRKVVATNVLSAYWPCRMIRSNVLVQAYERPARLIQETPLAETGSSRQMRKYLESRSEVVNQA